MCLMLLNAFRKALSLGLVFVSVVSSQSDRTVSCTNYYVDLAAGNTKCYAFYRATETEMMAAGASSDWEYMEKKCKETKIAMGAQINASIPVSINSQGEEDRLRQLLGDFISGDDFLAATISQVILGAGTGRGANLLSSGTPGWMDGSSADFIRRKVFYFKELKPGFCFYISTTGGFVLDNCVLPTGKNDAIVVICKAVLAGTSVIDVVAVHAVSTVAANPSQGLTERPRQADTDVVALGAVSTVAVNPSQKRTKRPKQWKRRPRRQSATSTFSFSSLTLLHVMVTLPLYDDA